MSRQNPWWYVKGKFYVLSILATLLLRMTYPSPLTEAAFWVSISYGIFVVLMALTRYMTKHR